MTDRWAAEMEAYKALADLMGQADRAQALFERAGLALPEPIKRLLGMTERSTNRSRRPSLPPPEVRSRPAGFQDDWISIDLANAMPITMIPAVLQHKSKPLKAKDLVAAVHEHLPQVATGSVVNSFSRLKGTLIDRREEGWVLIPGAKAGTVYDGRLWGPPATFQKTEIASHRREAILHVLRHYETGLQALQILEQLKACEWLHAPLTKDLVKEDLKALSDNHQIRRRGNTKKWEVVDAK